MAIDARISTGLPGHPKTKKLVRRLGPGAGWSLVCLFLWVAGNRSDGDLSDMSDEDIELAAEWDGEHGALVSALVSVRFLDGDEGSYTVHDWAAHNPWAAGSESRSMKARWNAAKRHHGEAEADRLVPEYAASRSATSIATSIASSTEALPSSNAPSPSPSPSLKAEANASSQSAVADQRPHSEILDAYHEALPACQRVEVLNDKRRKRIAAIVKLAKRVCAEQGWAYEPAEFWRAYFAECAADPWMRGEVPNPRNPAWKQNLDVLIAEDRFAGVMDRAIAAMRGGA